MSGLYKADEKGGGESVCHPGMSTVPTGRQDAIVKTPEGAAEKWKKKAIVGMATTTTTVSIFGGSFFREAAGISTA